MEERIVGTMRVGNVNVSGLLKTVCGKICGVATLRCSAVVVCGQLTGVR